MTTRRPALGPVLLVTLVALSPLLLTAPTAAATPGPAVSLDVAPDLVAASGGVVTVSVTVHGGTLCTFFASAGVTGFGATVSCPTGAMTRSAKVLADTGAARDIRLGIKVTASGKSVIRLVTVDQLGLASSLYLVATSTASGQRPSARVNGHAENPASIELAMTASPPQSAVLSFNLTCSEFSGPQRDVNDQATVKLPVAVELPLPGPSSQCQLSAVVQLDGSGKVSLSLLASWNYYVAAIPGAPGYVTADGEDGRPFPIGRPWGEACQPIVLSVNAQVPETVYVQVASVVAQARAEGVDVTVENRQYRWYPADLYPPGLTNSDVRFVDLFSNASSSPRFTNGKPEHIQFGWDTRREGSNDVLTSLQGILYLRNLQGPMAYRLATRQLIAFSQGVSATYLQRSGIAVGSTLDRFVASDLAAMQIMSGCHLV